MGVMRNVEARLSLIGKAWLLRSDFAAARRMHRRRLRGYKREDDAISAEYKKQIKDYWWRFHCRVPTRWHEHYSSRNGLCDVRYIPEELYYTVIDRHFNDRKYYLGVSDKNYLSRWFPQAKQPRTIVRKIDGLLYDADYHLTGFDDAIKSCLEHETVVIKPSINTFGGKNIHFWARKDGRGELERAIKGGDDLIAQETLVQHEHLSRIHPSSVNTVRVMTLLFDQEVHILSSVLRMGVDGSRVDNASAGGITCGIRSDGRLKDVAYARNGTRYDRHPQGFRFSEGMIPSFDKVIGLLTRLQEQMARFRLISWDVVIGPDGEPILLEGNFRCGGPCVHQLNNGPLFGDLTDRVLSEVFLRRRRSTGLPS